MLKLRTILLATATFLLCSCASWWQPKADTRLIDVEYMAAMGPELPEGAMGEKLATCYPAFAELESKRRAANVLYGGYYQVPGFPFLRVDRYLASYAGEVNDLDKLGRWLESMREYAHFSRSVELSELNMESVARSRLLHELSFCSVWLSLLTADQDGPRERMMKAIKESLPSLAQPVELPQTLDPQEPKNLKVWQTVAAADAAEETSTREHFEACELDALGRVGLISDEWVRLAAMHAPDVLSAQPLSSPLLADDEISVLNNGPARLHYHPSFARVADQALLQFSYFIWLPQDEKTDSGFKGSIWLITLDHKGQALIYDSIGLDGSNHQWYLAQDLEAAGETTANRKLIGATKVALTLALDGRITKVAPRDQVSSLPIAGTAEVLRFDDLSETPISNDQQRSMFNKYGRLRVAGTPIYMIGQHPAIDSKGNAFDDPRLIERSFKVDPARLILEAPKQCGFQVTIASNVLHTQSKPAATSAIKLRSH